MTTSICAKCKHCKITEEKWRSLSYYSHYCCHPEHVTPERIHPITGDTTPEINSFCSLFNSIGQCKKFEEGTPIRLKAQTFWQWFFGTNKEGRIY